MKTSGNHLVDAEDNSKKIYCEHCNGTGKVDKLEEVGVVDNGCYEMDCPKCEGKGHWWD